MYIVGACRGGDGDDTDVEECRDGDGDDGNGGGYAVRGGAYLFVLVV